MWIAHATRCQRYAHMGILKHALYTYAYTCTHNVQLHKSNFQIRRMQIGNYSYKCKSLFRLTACHSSFHSRQSKLAHTYTHTCTYLRSFKCIWMQLQNAFVYSGNSLRSYGYPNVHKASAFLLSIPICSFISGFMC